MKNTCSTSGNTGKMLRVQSVFCCLKNFICGKLPGFATRTGKFFSNESSSRNLTRETKPRKMVQLNACHRRNMKFKLKALKNGSFTLYTRLLNHENRPYVYHSLQSCTLYIVILNLFKHYCKLLTHHCK